MFVDARGLDVDVGAAARELRKEYDRLRSLGLNDHTIVAGLIKKSLRLANGNVFTAHVIALAARSPNNDNDHWASLDHFYQSWNFRWVVDNPIAGPCAGFVSWGYSILKYSDFVRLHLVPRDDPNVPPSKVTLLQFLWAQQGAWAAVWHSRDIPVDSQKWEEFVEWLDSCYTPGAAFPEHDYSQFQWWYHGG
jgi:hypothetical protein